MKLSMFSVVVVFVLVQIMCGFKFTQINAEYNIQDSRKYAAYSAVAFCPKQCVESWKCGTTSKYPSLINVTYIQNSVTKAVCYVGYDSSLKTVIISWRGSCNAQNWIEDFNFELQSYQRCKACFVHTGFMTDYRLNQKKMFDAINKIKSSLPVQKIISTGHSLGAALSTIAGVQLAVKYPGIQVSIHNFGCPRIGNENLAQFIRSKVRQIYRVVHNRDLFPHLPPESVYRHAPLEIFFDAQMQNYQVCDESGQDKNCSNKFYPSYTPDDHDFYFVHISATQCC